MTTSPGFLQHSTGLQCTREWRSWLWCWCGSVLTALRPAVSPNSAFPLPLLLVVSITVSIHGWLLQVPRAHTMIGQRSFSIAEPSLWNRLSELSTETGDDAAYYQVTAEVCSTWVDKQKWHYLPPGAVMAFLWILTYLLIGDGTGYSHHAAFDALGLRSGATSWRTKCPPKFGVVRSTQLWGLAGAKLPEQQAGKISLNYL